MGGALGGALGGRQPPSWHAAAATILRGAQAARGGARDVEGRAGARATGRASGGGVDVDQGTGASSSKRGQPWRPAAQHLSSSSGVTGAGTLHGSFSSSVAVIGGPGEAARACREGRAWFGRVCPLRSAPSRPHSGTHERQELQKKQRPPGAAALVARVHGCPAWVLQAVRPELVGDAWRAACPPKAA